MEQKSEYVGKMACSLCGNVCGVKKSPKGRFTLVCKWQDGGCGSQLQTLTADSGMMMMKKMQPLESQQEQAEPEQQAKQQPKPKKNKKKAEAWGLI